MKHIEMKMVIEIIVMKFMNRNWIAVVSFEDKRKCIKETESVHLSSHYVNIETTAQAGSSNKWTLRETVSVIK